MEPHLVLAARRTALAWRVRRCGAFLRRAAGALRQAGFEFKNQTIRPESVSGAMPPGFAIFVGKR
jgi:hypothetical protein